MSHYLVFDVGIKNLSFIDFTFDKSNYCLNRWECVSIVNSDVPLKKIGIGGLTDAMLECLGKYFTEDEKWKGGIYIENQPASLNGMMKTLSVVIYTFFKMRQKNVFFMNACNKLKCERAKLVAKTKMTYTERKKLAIRLALEYIEDIVPEKKDWFVKLKKADDYADTLLYSMYIIENL